MTSAGEIKPMSKQPDLFNQLEETLGETDGRMTVAVTTATVNRRKTP